MSQHMILLYAGGAKVAHQRHASHKPRATSSGNETAFSVGQPDGLRRESRRTSTVRRSPTISAREKSKQQTDVPEFSDGREPNRVYFRRSASLRRHDIGLVNGTIVGASDRSAFLECRESMMDARRMMNESRYCGPTSIDCVTVCVVFQFKVGRGEVARMRLSNVAHEAKNRE